MTICSKTTACGALALAGLVGPSAAHAAGANDYPWPGTEAAKAPAGAAPEETE
jgi:hypothetical protein